MTIGLSDNFRDLSGTCKTAVINNELLRLRVDITALQETRLEESGTLRRERVGTKTESTAWDSL